MTVQHIVKGKVPGFPAIAVTVQRPNSFIVGKKYPTLQVNSGIGEANPMLTEADLNSNYGHGLYGDDERKVGLRWFAAEYGIILIFTNTTDQSHYRNHEIELTADYAFTLPEVDQNNFNCLNHSLGGYGLTTTALNDNNYAKKLNCCFVSASGGNPGAEDITNLVNNNVKVCAVTSLQETVVSWAYTDNFYVKMKALKGDAKVMVTIFPKTEFTDPTKAHNAVLGRMLSKTPMLRADCTKGLPTGNVQMNIYQWILSNPKGSIYQPPTNLFTGPKYASTPTPTPVPTPTPTPTERKVIRVNITGAGTPGRINVVLQYIDSSGNRSSDPYFVATEVDTVQVNGKTRYTISNKGVLIKTFEI